MSYGQGSVTEGRGALGHNETYIPGRETLSYLAPAIKGGLLSPLYSGRCAGTFLKMLETSQNAPPTPPSVRPSPFVTAGRTFCSALVNLSKASWLGQLPSLPEDERHQF